MGDNRNKKCSFSFNNSFSIVSKMPPVIDIFIIVPIFLLHLIRMRGVGLKKVSPLVN